LQKTNDTSSSGVPRVSRAWEKKLSLGTPTQPVRGGIK